MMKDFALHSPLSPVTIAKRFGTWEAALEKAGLSDRSFRGTLLRRLKYSDEAIFEELRRVAKLTNKTVLTIEDFRKHSAISDTAIQRRFGTWNRALERACLSDMSALKVEGSVRIHMAKYSDEDLLEEVRRVAKLVGLPGTCRYPISTSIHSPSRAY